MIREGNTVEEAYSSISRFIRWFVGGYLCFLDHGLLVLAMNTFLSLLGRVSHLVFGERSPKPPPLRLF
jgi:hypothetical protein